MDELVIFGIVIILFFAGLAVCTGFVSLYTKQSETNELFDCASDIAFKLLSSEQLVFEGQLALFDSVKLAEIDEIDIKELVSIPTHHKLTVFFIDLYNNQYNTILSMDNSLREANINENPDRAVVNYPSNIRINELEVHAAKMTVILER
jgi:hypothetical protein